MLLTYFKNIFSSGSVLTDFYEGKDGGKTLTSGMNQFELFLLKALVEFQDYLQVQPAIFKAACRVNVLNSIFHTTSLEISSSLFVLEL